MHARLIVVTLAAVLAACAQSPLGTTPQKSLATSTNVAAADQSFASQAAAMGMSEVTTGRLAAERASTSEVRAFGRELAQAHGRHNDRLRSIASQNRMNVPAQPSAAEAARIDRLDDLTGPAFDRAFVNQMVTSHQEAVRLFETEAAQGTSPALRTYASQTLPHLREHLARAQTLAQRQGS